jgi:hypothetical protein
MVLSLSSVSAYETVSGRPRAAQLPFTMAGSRAGETPEVLRQHGDGHAGSGGRLEHLEDGGGDWHVRAIT